MKKKVTIQIVVDMNSPDVAGWHKPSDFFEAEVDDAISEIRSISRSPRNRYSRRTGTSKTGTTYKVFTSSIREKIPKPQTQ